MKKIILTSALIIAAVASGLTANAQEKKVRIGVKLNGTLTNVKLSDLQGSSSKFREGAAAGAFTTIRFTDHFALQPELMFNYTEAKATFAGDRHRFKYGSVEMPVYAMWQRDAGKGKIFMGIGPHIGYGFSIDTKTERLPEGHPDENKVELDHWYMGGSFTTGYEFRNRLSISAGYQMGWDLSSKNKSSNVRTQTISLGVGYKF